MTSEAPSIDEIRGKLNESMMAHLKEINMTPFTVYEVSGRAMLYISMLVKHYGWNDEGLKLMVDMAKTFHVPGIVVNESDLSKTKGN